MVQNKHLSRRRILALTGTSTAALLAGCGGPGDDDTEEPAPEEDPAEEDGTGVDNGEEDEEEVDEEEDEDEEEEEEENGEDDDEEEEEDDNGEDDEDENDENGNGDWADVDEILLDGYTPGWEGVEPEMIEGETNPTLELIEGQEYEITWENADGDLHNIEIWDEDDEVVDDYETEVMDDEGETQTLEFEATDEMVAYVCEVHVGTMFGDIEVESE